MIRSTMYSVPDVDDVVAIADTLGIHLVADEAVLYRKYLADRLATMDAFVQARIDENPPPLRSAAREPGCRPTPADDPLNA